MSRGEQEKTTLLIQAARDILLEESPMTIRQLFYRLVSTEDDKGHHWVINSTAGYHRVIRLMTIARKDDRCEYGWIVDRSRPDYSPYVFDDLQGYAKHVQRGYRKDYWEMQKNHVEIFVEKDSIIGSVEDTCDELGVSIRVGRGYVSTTKIHEIARRFKRIKKPIFVFYLGDHDPSGRGIETDIKRRLLEHGSPEFEMKRLAIHAGDIKRFKLPPLKAKRETETSKGDSRTPAFLKKYKDECVELDALPPNVLRRRIVQAVDELRDCISWDRAIAVEKVEMASIERTVNLWPRKKVKA
jgi:hypothetical protein